MGPYKATKYTLFACCYIFWVASGVLLAVGVYAKLAKENDVVDTLTTDPALLLLTVGSLMFIITFLGCFGALRDAAILLKMFLGILLVILLLQITAAVLGFIFSDMVLQRTELLMKKGIVLYREDMDLENMIDFVQKKFLCCGVDHFSDWSQNMYFNCAANNPSLEACGVPFSCCVRQRNEHAIMDVQMLLFTVLVTVELLLVSQAHSVMTLVFLVFCYCFVIWGHPEEDGFLSGFLPLMEFFFATVTLACFNWTVLNTMCGYETQRRKELSLRGLIYTNGCLKKIVLWGKQNLLLVAGLSIGLLCLEICMVALAAVQIGQIQQAVAARSKPVPRKGR